MSSSELDSSTKDSLAIDMIRHIVTEAHCSLYHIELISSEKRSYNENICHKIIPL